MGAKEDGWNDVKSKTRKREREYVKCLAKGGCEGRCPRSVVVAGKKPGGTPAKCFECGLLYKLVPGDNRAVPPPSKGSQRKLDTALGKVRNLEAEVKALKAQHPSGPPLAKTSAGGEAGDVVPVATSALDEAKLAAKGRLEAAKKQLAWVRNMGDAEKPLLEPQGGHAKVEADLAQKVASLDEALRGAEPLPIRESKAKWWEASKGEALKRAETKLKALEESRAQLESKCEQAKASVLLCKQVHAKATADLKGIQAERLALEIPALAAPAPSPQPADADSPSNVATLRAFWMALGEQKFIELCGGDKRVAEQFSKPPGDGTAHPQPGLSSEQDTSGRTNDELNGSDDDMLDVEYFQDDAEEEVAQCGAEASPEQVAERKKKVSIVAHSKLSAVKKLKALKPTISKGKG
jgi:hypothetical protein